MGQGLRVKHVLTAPNGVVTWQLAGHSSAKVLPLPAPKQLAPAARPYQPPTCEWSDDVKGTVYER